MEWGIPLLLALAVSIDGFSVGFSCGLRKLGIPFVSLIIICLLSSGAIALSMLSCSWIRNLELHRSISALGGFVLIALGLIVIWQHCSNGLIGVKRCNKQELSQVDKASYLKKIEFYLKQPERADLDNSGVLSAGEALLLGSALAADAFAAGFGAALIGSPLWPTVLTVGLTKFILVPLGVAFGRVASLRVAPAYIPLLGGAILIFLGIINLL